MLTDLQRLIAHAVLLNSALYLAGCFVAGLALHNGWAWRLALAAAGVTYLCYSVQSYYLSIVRDPDDRPDAAPFFLLVASVILGAAAGIALLF